MLLFLPLYQRAYEAIYSKAHLFERDTDPFTYTNFIKVLCYTYLAVSRAS